MESLTLTAMTMEWTLQAPAGDRDELEAAAAHVQSDLDWIEDVFSTFREDSWISRISRREARVADAPPVVATVLELCEQFHARTDGAFDARTPGGGIDPTGIVKTWALERVRWRWGLDNSLWGCGGDAIASGSAGAEPFRIGIDDPRAPRQGRLIDAVALTGHLNAIATSGLAEHAGHIWNPATGEAADAYDQVSVMGGDLIAADAWATAIVAGGPDTAKAAIEDGFEVLTVKVVDGGLAAQRSPCWPTLRQS